MLAVLAMWGSLVGRAQGQEAAARDSAPPSRLFDANEVLNLRLAADFGAIGKDRGTTKRQFPGVLTYVSPAGDSVSLDVQIQTRGHFRLRTCQYPPLKITFARELTANTPFAKQKSLKLVVQCRGGQGFANYLLEEYLIYRSFNLLTDLSFRVRLARVTYADTKKNDPPETRFGFFVEDDDRVARRNRGQVLAQQGMAQEETDNAQMGLVGTFQYMIGNTDWSVGGLHNIVLVKDSSNVVFPVPYDFDWSGVIGAPYAVPDSRLGIRSVRERLWRTACRTEAELAPIIAKFTRQKDAIYALYRAQEGLEAKRVNWALEYYDDFYRTLTDPRAMRAAMRVACPGS